MLSFCFVTETWNFYLLHGSYLGYLSSVHPFSIIPLLFISPSSSNHFSLSISTSLISIHCYYLLSKLSHSILFDELQGALLFWKKFPSLSFNRLHLQTSHQVDKAKWINCFEFIEFLHLHEKFLLLFLNLGREGCHCSTFRYTVTMIYFYCWTVSIG